MFNLQRHVLDNPAKDEGGAATYWCCKPKPRGERGVGKCVLHVHVVDTGNETYKTPSLCKVGVTM